MTRRREIVRAGFRGDEATVRAAFTETSPQVRASALNALVRMGRLEPADLVAALTDPEPSVRRFAATVVARTGGPTAARPSLCAVLVDEDERVVEAAAFAVGEQHELHPGELDALIEIATDHPDSLCRESAVAALGSLGDPAGLAAVLRAITDRATVRRRAVLALVAFDDPAVEDALERLRSDRDLQVRQAAEDLLAISEGAEVAAEGD